MVDFNIGKNQGITQAIRDKIGAANIKNTDLETWQSVVSLVDSAKQNDSIFKKQGSDGAIFTTDKTKIDDKSSYQTNYVVDEGRVTIDNGIWEKIEKLLTGSETENVVAKAEIKLNEDFNKLTTKEDREAEYAEIDERRAKANFEKSLRAYPIQNPVVDAKVDSGINTNDVNVPVLATGKQLTRSVNGTPQNIEILNINGQKVRFAVNDDGTRGERLITVSTAGKNKYVTQSQFDSDVRKILGLGEEDAIPTGIQPTYVTIGGQSNIVFKKDGKTMDGKQLHEFMDKYSKSHNTELTEIRKKVRTTGARLDHKNFDLKSLLSDTTLI